MYCAYSYTRHNAGMCVCVSRLGNMRVWVGGGGTAVVYGSMLGARYVSMCVCADRQAFAIRLQSQSQRW